MWEGGKEDTREEGMERGERGGGREGGKIRGREGKRERGERGGGKEGGRGERRRRVSKDMKVSGYEGYEGVCNSIWVYERGREMTRRRVCVKSCSHVYTTISCVCVRL